MKTITLSVSETEFAMLEKLTLSLDPTGSIKLTTVSKGMLIEGMIRSATRVGVSLPADWMSTEAVKRSLAVVR